MCNTLIYLWIKPLIIAHKRGRKKVYFECVVKGDHSTLSKGELDKFIEGDILADIMDFAEIESNWDFKCLSAIATNEEETIRFSESPKERASRTNRELVVSGEQELFIKEKDLEIQETGEIAISLPKYGVTDKINFPKIWEVVESKLAGKLQDGDSIVISNEQGDKIIEIWGGAHLNVGGMAVPLKVMGKDGQIKGGLYIREDGRIDIGDFERTVFVQIYTGNLLKTSFRLGQSVESLTEQKLIENEPNKTKEV